MLLHRKSSPVSSMRRPHSLSSLKSFSSSCSSPLELGNNENNTLLPLHHSDSTSRQSPEPPRERSRQSSIVSDRSCGGMTDGEMRDLWRCMLELQERYVCYRSTRMDLALEAGEEGVNLMPNRFIIDVLNDSIVDLPSEGWDMLLHHLDQPLAAAH